MPLARSKYHPKSETGRGRTGNTNAKRAASATSTTAVHARASGLREHLFDCGIRAIGNRNVRYEFGYGVEFDGAQNQTVEFVSLIAQPKIPAIVNA
jgi:hypothetical protein